MDGNPSAARQLLLFPGFACLAPLLAGGVVFLAAFGDVAGMAQGLGLFLGGLAGAWGSETLRRRPGHRTRPAIAALVIGLGATVLLFLTVEVR